MEKNIVNKVLVLDDEEKIIKALRRLLKSHDIEVACFTAGQEALDFLKDNDIAVIISDQRMPGMTGDVFLEKARTLKPNTVRIMLTGYADIDATINAINSGAIKYYFNKPWDDDTLINQVKESIELYNVQEENRYLLQLTEIQNQKLQDLNSTLRKKVEAQTKEIINKNRKLKTSFMEIIKAFSNIVEIRLKDVGNHSHRVAGVVKKILGTLELSGEEVQNVIVAAFLHDIGKINLSDEIIAKKDDQYTVEDLEEIRKHPELGYNCVSRIEGFGDIGTAIKHHHENYNGNGYPDSLKGDNIPLGARIIRIADAFDHFVYDFEQPNEQRINKACAYLLENAGTLFDPALVRNFISIDMKQVTQVSGNDDNSVLLEPSKLVMGMKVVADVYTTSGKLLLQKGVKLSPGTISKIYKTHKIDPIVEGVRVEKIEKLQEKG